MLSQVKDVINVERSDGIVDANVDANVGGRTEPIYQDVMRKRRNYDSTHFQVARKASLRSHCGIRDKWAVGVLLNEAVPGERIAKEDSVCEDLGLISNQARCTVQSQTRNLATDMAVT